MYVIMYDGCICMYVNVIVLIMSVLHKSGGNIIELSHNKKK